MIRIVITLLAHDLGVALKNKTLWLVVGIPLFVCATLALVDPADAPAARTRIALLQTRPYAPILLQAFERADAQIDVRWVSDEAEAMLLLKDREVDGFLVPDEDDVARVRLTVVQQASPETVSILERVRDLQASVEGRGPSWIADVRPLQAGSIQRLTQPTWILMMVLLVSFIVLPAQVAEEKEKQQLLGWLQTPVRESEWLVAKLVYGIVLVLASVAALQFMAAEFPFTHGGSYLAMLCAGGFCFGATGICLGLLCRNQASARTLGVLCYLPLLMPAALADMSRELGRIAPLIPSYQFYEPIRAMMLEDGAHRVDPRAWITLVAIGLLACLASHRLIKRRWLM